MKKSKTVIGLIIALVIMNTIPTMACTPSLGIPNLPNLSDFKWEMPDELKEQLNNAVDVYIEEKTLETPKITESKYVHNQLIWSPNRLQIRWNDVENATSYEIKITKPDGPEETYTSEDTSLILTGIGCLKQKIYGNWKSATVQVKAVGEDGKSSYWSEVNSISCNQIHW